MLTSASFSRHFSILASALAILTLSGCNEQEASSSPAKVASDYWQYLMIDETEKAQALINQASIQIEPQNLSPSNPIKQVEVGQAIVLVPTKVTLSLDQGNEQTVSIDTVLTQVDGQWRIQHSQTHQQLQGIDIDEQINKIDQNIREIIKDGSNQLGDVVDQLNKGFIDNLEAFGNALEEKAKELKQQKDKESNQPADQNL